jgi:tetratricopeptide (TPR) repeat protein
MVHNLVVLMNKVSVKYLLLALLIVAISAFFILQGRNKKNKTENDDFEHYINSIYQKSFHDPHEALCLLDSVSYNRNNNEEELAFLFFKKGEINILNHQYKDVLKNTCQAYNYYKNSTKKYTAGLCLITLSSAYAHLEQYQNAQEVALDALKIAEEIGNPTLLGKVYNRLFNLHIALDDFDIALQYILRSDSLFEVLRDTASLSACKNNIGAVYLKIENYDHAIKYFKQAVFLHAKEEDKRPLISSLNNLGYAYMQVKDFDNAIKYMHQSISLNNQIACIVNPAPYKGLGKIYQIMDMADSSNFYYAKAFYIYEKEAKYSDMINTLNNLISSNFIYKNYNEAISWQTIRDSVQEIRWKKEKEELLSFANVNYEVLKKEQEVLQQKQKSRNNYMILSFMVLLLIILLFAITAMYSNLRLRSEKNTTELEHKLLRIQMNPHFIFNTLAAIQHIILDGDHVKSIKIIAKFSRLMRQTFEYVRRESISLNQEISMISNYVETQQARFNHKFIYLLNVDKTIDLDKVKIPPMLLQPFIENSIEYGLRHLKKPGKLRVDILSEGDFLQFKVRDNGIGRSKMKEYEQSDKEIHATDVFISRLKKRRFDEELSFKVIDLFNTENCPAGTLIQFKLKVND